MGISEFETSRRLGESAKAVEAAPIADASTAHALNATFSDTEVEGALNALGTKLNSVLAALRQAGIVSE